MKKNYGEAEKHLREALKKNDRHAPAHMYLGVALVGQKQLEEAERELRRSVELGGGAAGRAYYYLGGIYWGRRDYKRAADELEAYLKLQPKAPDAERTRAAIKELRSKS